MPLSAPTKYTGTQQQQRPAAHLPLELPGETRSPASALAPTPASASLRSAALPSRTCHRAPPARRPSPASALAPTPASAPPRSAALSSRTCHRALPARRPSPANARAPTPASAPLRNAALPLRTHHRAPPVNTRRRRLLHQRPRRYTSHLKLSRRSLCPGPPRSGGSISSAPSPDPSGALSTCSFPSTSSQSGQK